MPHEIPPDPEWEEALVGYCIHQPSGMIQVRRLVQELEGPVVVGPLAPVWEGIRRIVLRGEEPTPAALAAELSAEAWPFRAVEELARRTRDHVMGGRSPEEARRLADAIADKLVLLQRRREAAGALYTAWLGVTAEGLEAAQPYVERASAILRSISSTAALPSAGALAEEAYLTAKIAAEARAQGDPPDLMYTGLETLDRGTGGLEAPDLWVIAAYTSRGKTSLALQIARYVANSGRVVLIVSVEMSPHRIGRKLAASAIGARPADMRQGLLTEADLERLADAVMQLSTLPMYVDGESTTVWQIRARARALRERMGRVDLVIVDYLQLLDPNAPAENRQQEVAGVSKALKLLAREFDVPVIALSQLTRASQQRREPELRDLRESGAIEQDADWVVFIHDPGQADESGGPPSDPTAMQHRELLVAKGREGPTFRFGCAWDPLSQTFEDDAVIARRAELRKRRRPFQRADSEPVDEGEASPA
jgi:replicative DNA helicase